MKALHSTVRIIDQFTEKGGKLLAWLCLAMALLSFLVVVLRYGFGFGSIAMQEAVTYMHASLFMLGTAFTLKHGGHVRVDIFYRRLSQRGCAWVNSIGAIIFLLPLSIFLIAISWQFVTGAWAIGEGSADPGGIHGVFLLKSLIPLMGLQLLLQGLAELFRNTLFLLEDGH
jgi:TRAP-type mannitol/chloroaromatic compound transport system permease small subunit